MTKNIHKSILIWYAPKVMFDLVVDIANYPQFLPWCSNSRIIEHTTDYMIAEVELSIANIKHQFTTKNTHSQQQQPNGQQSWHIDMQLVNGPFSHLKGRWNFSPIVNNTSSSDANTAMVNVLDACTVELTLEYAFNNRLLATAIGPIFDKIANNLVDAFVQRAQQLYG